GMRNCKMKQMTLPIANARAERSNETKGSLFFITSTRTAPAANPNMASEIAMKAKWYHIVTLNIRVRNSSSCRSDSVVRKRPTYVERLGFRFTSITDDQPQGYLNVVERLTLNTGKRVGANVNAASNRTNRKHFEAAAVVYGEMCSYIRRSCSFHEE